MLHYAGNAKLDVNGKLAFLASKEHPIPMPTAVHDIITDFFERQMTDWVDDGFLTREIRKQIRFMPRMPGFRCRRTRKNLSWKKEPDLRLGFGKLGHESIPRLVIEVGFSQPKKDLVDDAVEWLSRHV